jgi:hypothetical protein
MVPDIDGEAGCLTSPVDDGQIFSSSAQIVLKQLLVEAIQGKEVVMGEGCRSLMLGKGKQIGEKAGLAPFDPALGAEVGGELGRGLFNVFGTEGTIRGFLGHLAYISRLLPLPGPPCPTHVEATADPGQGILPVFD